MGGLNSADDGLCALLCEFMNKYSYNSLLLRWNATRRDQWLYSPGVVTDVLCRLISCSYCSSLLIIFGFSPQGPAEKGLTSTRVSSHRDETRERRVSGLSTALIHSWCISARINTSLGVYCASVWFQSSLRTKLSNFYISTHSLDTLSAEFGPVSYYNQSISVRDCYFSNNLKEYEVECKDLPWIRRVTIPITLNAFIIVKYIARVEKRSFPRFTPAQLIARGREAAQQIAQTELYQTQPFLHFYTHSSNWYPLKTRI